LSLVLAVVVGLLIVQNVLAVHDLAFELDGNVTTQGTSPYPIPHGPTVDWASFFDTNGAELPLPPGFTASGFEPDFNLNTNGSFNTSDGTTYTTGSKDTLPISGWQCTAASNVNSKIDIMNAYAAEYHAGNDDIIYFGLERNTNTGDANVAFWFLQDDVGCSTPGPNGEKTLTFTGEHKDGDIFVVSAFTNGGAVSTIDVYRWDRNNGSPDCALNPIGPACVLNPPGVPGFLRTQEVAHGVDCSDPQNSPAGDNVCATTNSGTTNANNVTQPTTITTPWLTANKADGAGHTLRVSEFFEGGLNLTQTGLGGKCFNVFIGDTRSSQSLTATLFDFARGRLGACGSDTVTTPSVANTNTVPPGPGSVEIPASGVQTVSDSATVTVTGVATWSGTVEFHLCGPFALTDTTTLCTSGGVAAGSKAVSQSGVTVASDTMMVTKVGRYCWRGDFSGDNVQGVPSSSDSRNTECFYVTPKSAILTTTAGAGPVDFGQPVTDTAILSNTANKPGTGGPAGSTDGSINPATPGGPAGDMITFTLYGPSTSGCGTVASTAPPAAGTNPQVVPVTGNNTYGPVSFTPGAPGTYHWVAEYHSDSPNTVGTTHNSNCNVTAEDVVVQTIETRIKTNQSWYPNDTATVSSSLVGNSLGANGTLVFDLYAGATCSGTKFYTQTFTVTGGANSETKTTTNTTVPITTLLTDPAASSTGQYSWLVTYTVNAADTAHTGRRSTCAAENFTTTYTNDNSGGVKFP
jgi:hypothetical protein